MAWGTSVDNLERGFANKSIHHVVVSKLNRRQDGFPALLLVTMNAHNVLPKMQLTTFVWSSVKDERPTKLQLFTELIQRCYKTY